MTTRSALHSNLAIHPGEILAEELHARDMTERDLATAMGRHEELVGAICRGDEAITAEIAIALEHALDGPSADFWLGLQFEYDLTIARARDAAGTGTSPEFK